MELKTKAQLESTSPSRKDKISAEEEANLRKGTCLFIQQAELIATTCLYLAAKTAETPRKIRDIVNVSYQVLNSKTLRISSEYWDIKDVIVKMESVVLRTLGFELSISHPHNFMLNYLHSLKADDRLAQLSWNILSDSYLNTICLQYKPHEIATSCIVLASKILSLDIPDGEDMAWWAVFGGEWKNIEEICNQIMDTYESGMQEEVYVGTSEWMKLVDRKSNPNTPTTTPRKDQ